MGKNTGEGYRQGAVRGRTQFQHENGDWQKRTHRVDPERRHSISSDFLLPEAVRSVTEPLFESANVFTEIRPGWWTTVNIATAETPADGLSSRAERMELEYTIGVDNVSQRT